MSTEWPVAFFDEDYLRIYRPMFTPEGTAREVEFIERALALPAGAAVLDLACGFGRHAIGMAARGHRVTGVDFNPAYLALAGTDARAVGVEVGWIAADMRALPFDREFDGVYSFFTSFGYFADPENEQVLAQIARALKPGGRFLLDLVNRDFLLTHPQQRSWTQRPDGALLMEETTLDVVRSRVVTRQMLIEPEGGVRVTKEYELRAYTCAELTALMSRHGLVTREAWGDADGAPYSVESRRLVILAARDR